MKDSDLLATVPIFSALSANVLDELLSRMTKRSYQKNNMILMEDEFGDTFFIIAGGSIKITRVSEDGREVILAMLGEGEFFGEMSLLDGETRSANAIAIEESKVLILKRHDFLLFLERFPKIAISLLTEMAGRIRKSDQQIESLSLSDAVKSYEKDLIIDALKITRGNRARAATLLRSTERIVRYKVKQYDIDCSRFRI